MENVKSVFDEIEETRKIVSLQKQIDDEDKKAEPDRLQIARWQREIVVIRQNIIENMKNR